MATQDKIIREFSELKLNIHPTETADIRDACDKILELQLKMATSSINHEYARIEYDDTRDIERREELLGFMDDCRIQYLDARNSLGVHDPNAVENFEADLLRQKQTVNSQFYI